MTYWSLKTSTHPDNMLVYNRGDPFDGFLGLPVHGISDTGRYPQTLSQFHGLNPTYDH